MKALLLLAGLVATTGALGQDPATPEDRFLARHDRNGDGRLDREEYRNFTVRLFARRDANGDGRLGPGEHAADTGDVERDQFLAESDAAFTAHDSNGDGYLDAAELRAARASRRAEEET